MFAKLRTSKTIAKRPVFYRDRHGAPKGSNPAKYAVKKGPGPERTRVSDPHH